MASTFINLPFEQVTGPVEVIVDATLDSIKIKGPSGDAMVVNPGGSINTLPVSLAIRLDEADDTTTYVGKALPGAASDAASWEITRLTTTGGELVVEYADGNANFDNVWDDRADLDYA